MLAHQLFLCRVSSKGEKMSVLESFRFPNSHQRYYLKKVAEADEKGLCRSCFVKPRADMGFRCVGCVDKDRLRFRKRVRFKRQVMREKG